MVQYINTIKDLEAATYGFGGQYSSNNQILKGAGIVAGLASGHDGSLSSLGSGTASANLSALYNKVYGQKVWSMLNQEINPLSILPKRPYTSSGWRVMTKRPAGGGDAKLTVADTAYSAGSAFDAPMADEIGGVSENAAFNSTGFKALAPEYTTLFMSPKTIAHYFDYSEVAAEMAKIDDGVGDLRALIREDMGKFHAEVQSKMLVMPLEYYDLDAATAILEDASTALGGSAAAQVYADMENNLTSLFKIVATSAEIHEMTVQGIAASANGGAASDDISKLYGNTDRKASTAVGSSVGFMDAYVNFGDGYAATEQRPLTLSILNATIQNLRTNGGTPKVILTGFDTVQAIADLLQSQERFLEMKEVVPTHNGVKGVSGRETGFRVATYYDIPLIPAKDMRFTANHATTTGLSDLLFLDTDHLWLSVLKPTQYFEAGITHGDPFGVGVLGNRGLFRTMSEVGCSFFKGQGKVTNVK